MSQVRGKIQGALAGIRGDLKSVTKAVLWATIGSMVTLFAVAPKVTITSQLLLLEGGLLVGMALGYLSFGRESADR